MSKNDVLMVPRRLLERCKQFTFDIRSPQILRSDIDAVLNKPVEQHQGEPVAWIFRELPDAPLQVTDRWDVAKHLPFDVTSVYPHADPVDVERLRAEVKDLLHTSVKEEVFEIVCKERDTLLAQLAERDAQFNTLFTLMHDLYETLPDDARKTLDALSTRVAPREPEAMICSEDGRVLWQGDLEDLRLIRAAIYSSAELSAAKCGCNTRTKLVGDGCEVCNPNLAAELKEETPN